MEGAIIKGAGMIGGVRDGRWGLTIMSATDYRSISCKALLGLVRRFVICAVCSNVVYGLKLPKSRSLR